MKQSSDTSALHVMRKEKHESLNEAHALKLHIVDMTTRLLTLRMEPMPHALLARSVYMSSRSILTLDLEVAHNNYLLLVKKVNSVRTMMGTVQSIKERKES